MKRFFIIFFVSTLFTINGYSQTEISRAQANFIYNFTKFFDWPQVEKSGDFIIGVYGSRDLAYELERVTKGKKNITQNIVINYFQNISQVTKCHVVYVDALSSNKIDEIQAKTGLHCLMISDSKTAIEKGAIIQFILDANRLKYKFSKENALKHELKFHSKVYEMSTK